MEQIVLGFQNITSSLGATVTTPVLLVLVALIIGVRPGQAVRSGLTSGACLVAILLVSGSIRTTLAQLAAEVGGSAEYLGIEITDVGWEPSMVISFASKLGIYIIPIYFVLNLILLAMRATRTINIDISNFWHVPFVGAMVETLTDNFVYGMLAVIITIILNQFLADIAAPRLQEHVGVQGVSVAQGFTVAFVPIAMVVNRLFSLVPAFRDHPVTLETLRKKLGFVGEPIVLGGILGGVLAALANRDIYSIFYTAFFCGAIVYLMPKILELLAENFEPVAQGLKKFAQEKMKITGSIYIGISSSFSTASSTVLLTTMALIPPLMWTAKYTSFSGYIPSGSLYMLPFVMVLVVAVCKGDIIQSLVAGYLSIVTMLYCGTALSGLFTEAAIAASPEVYGAMGIITSICDASSPIAWGVIMFATFGLAGLGLLLIFVIGLAMWNHNQITGKGGGPLFNLARPRKSKKEKKAADADASPAEVQEVVAALEQDEGEQLELGAHREEPSE